MNARKRKKTGPRPEPLTPYEMGLRDGGAATARGEIPGPEALAKAARIIAAARARKRAAAEDHEAAPRPVPYRSDMGIRCAEGGCLVDCGVRFAVCSDPSCCCSNLPVRAEPKRAPSQDRT